MGSIFGIYEPDEACMIEDGALDSSLEACITNVCQPGRNLLAAGYCLYSSCHTFVLTVGDGVYGFTLDPYVGEFVLTHSKIQVGRGLGLLQVWVEGSLRVVTVCVSCLGAHQACQVHVATALRMAAGLLASARGAFSLLHPLLRAVLACSVLSRTLRFLPRSLPLGRSQ